MPDVWTASSCGSQARLQPLQEADLEGTSVPLQRLERGAQKLRGTDARSTVQQAVNVVSDEDLNAEASDKNMLERELPSDVLHDQVERPLLLEQVHEETEPKELVSKGRLLDDRRRQRAKEGSRQRGSTAKPNEIQAIQFNSKGQSGRC